MLRRILLSSAGAMALAAVAQAAEPLPPPPPPPPPPTWTGPYVGVNGGYAFGAGGDARGFQILPGEDQAFDDAAINVWRLSDNLRGGFGGGQLGYNYQFVGSPWVVGVETDFQGAGIRTGATGFLPLFPLEVTNDGFNTVFRFAERVDFFGTVRGRLGWSPVTWPTLLVYVTGGLAYGEVRHQFDASVGIVGTDDAGGIFGRNNVDRLQAGWTVGGGFEWLFSPNWSLKVEYLYVDLGRSSVPLVGSFPTGTVPENFFFGADEVQTRFHTIKAGLNYHFWTAPPPVIAKY
jgi:outer membrane immunogenic protein